MSEPLPEVPPLEQIEVVQQYPYFVAMIINGVVRDVMNVEGQQAAKFLAQPTFVQVGPTTCQVGWKYDTATGTFSPSIPQV